MESSFPNIKDYFSYYHLTLSFGGMERYMGRVNHLQVIELRGEMNREGISHSIRFYDRTNHRELLGTVCPREDGALILDMGHGKTYYFKKLERLLQLRAHQESPARD